MSSSYSQKAARYGEEIKTKWNEVDETTRKLAFEILIQAPFLISGVTLLESLQRLDLKEALYVMPKTIHLSSFLEKLLTLTPVTATLFMQESSEREHFDFHIVLPAHERTPMLNIETHKQLCEKKHEDKDLDAATLAKFSICHMTRASVQNRGIWKDVKFPNQENCTANLSLVRISWNSEVNRTMGRAFIKTELEAVEKGIFNKQS